MHRQQRLRPSPSSTLSSSTQASSPSPLTLPLSSLTSPSSPVSLSTSSPMSWSQSSSAATLWSPSWSASSSSFTAYPWSAHRSWCSRLSSFPKETTAGSGVSALVSGSKSSIPCPRLLSVVAWSMTLLLISSCMGLADAGILNGHPLGKRSFIDIQCKGIYDKSIFARLDRICEDCYNLFREPQLHQLCRKNCFTSDYFKGCLDVLLLQDEVEKIQTWIKQLHGAEPGV